MTLTSVHGATIDATPGRTVLHYRDGFLQNDAQTFATAGEARQRASDRNVIASHSPMPAINRYHVAG